MVKLGNWKSSAINPQSGKTEFSIRRINLNCKFSENFIDWSWSNFKEKF